MQAHRSFLCFSSLELLFLYNKIITCFGTVSSGGGANKQKKKLKAFSVEQYGKKNEKYNKDGFSVKREMVCPGSVVVITWYVYLCTVTLNVCQTNSSIIHSSSLNDTRLDCYKSVPFQLFT